MNIKVMRIKISRFSAEKKIKRRGWFLIILGQQLQTIATIASNKIKFIIYKKIITRILYSKF